MQPNQLDRDVITLAKAIRQTESGGDFNAVGQSGERGGYQFTKPTWQGWAQKHLGDANAQLTPENQNKVAYSQIKEWKDQGYNPGQIASLWNSGSPDPTGKVGVNKYGVNYDTPSYVNKVVGTYKQFKGQMGTQTANAAQTTPQPIQQPVEQQKAPLMQRIGDTADTIFGGGKIGEYIGKNIARGTYGDTIQKMVVGQDLNPEAEAMVEAGPTKKQLLGDVARVGLNFAPIGRLSAGLSSRLAQEGVKRSNLLGNVATGAGVGYGFESANSVREGGTATPQPGLETAIGAAIPLAGPVLRTAGNLVGKSAKFATGQATGLNQDTISQILKTPEAFSGTARANIDRAGLASNVLGDITKRQKALSTTGAAYEPLRNAPGFVNVPKDTIKTTLEKYGFKLKGNKIIATAESRPMAKSDIKQIEDFISQYGKSIKISNSAFFNAKERLSQLSKYEQGRADTARSLARDLRKAYEGVGDTQIKGLQQLDELYAPQKRQLTAIKKDYFNRDGSLKDNAISKLANLTGKGKDAVLARLEQVRPGVTEEIKILKAVEDIESSTDFKVGGYLPAAFRGTLGVTAVATGNIPAAVAAILSQPQLAVPILRRFGIAKNAMGEVVKLLKEKLAQQASQGATPGDYLLNKINKVN